MCFQGTFSENVFLLMMNIYHVHCGYILNASRKPYFRFKVHQNSNIIIAQTRFDGLRIRKYALKLVIIP